MEDYIISFTALHGFIVGSVMYIRLITYACVTSSVWHVFLGIFVKYCATRIFSWVTSGQHVIMRKLIELSFIAGYFLPLCTGPCYTYCCPGKFAALMEMCYSNEASNCFLNKFCGFFFLPLGRNISRCNARPPYSWRWYSRKILIGWYSCLRQNRDFDYRQASCDKGGCDWNSRKGKCLSNFPLKFRVTHLIDIEYFSSKWYICNIELTAFEVYCASCLMVLF